MGLAAYEPAGFSSFTQISPGLSGTQLRLIADQGRQFIVERTSDFNTWNGISTNVAWEGVLDVEDPAPPPNAPVFYRAQTFEPQ
jgi:hypothetical protein